MSSFVRNSFWTFASQCSIVLIGIATSVIIARVLQPEGRGVYSVSVFLPSFLMYFCNLGIGFSTVYYTANGEFDSEIVFGNGLLIALIHIFVAVMLGLLAIVGFRDRLFAGVETKYLYLSLAIAPGQMMVSYLAMVCLGMQRIKQYNLFQSLRPLFIFVCIFIFLVVVKLGITGAIIADMLVTYGISILFFIVIVRHIGMPSFRVNKKYVKAAYLYGIKTYVGSIVFFLNNRLNILLINLFLNPFAVGIFTLSYGVSEKLWLVSDAIATNLFPRVSAEKDPKRVKQLTPLVFKTTVVAIILISVFLWIVGEKLITCLFSDEFANSVAPFKILLIGTICYSGWRILESDLRGRGKVNIAMVPISLSFVVCMTLNFLLIPKYGVIGASWAATVTSMVTLISGVILYCRSSGNKVSDLTVVSKTDVRIFKRILVESMNMLVLKLHKKV